MNQELQSKFNQIIEDNFSKSESAVLVRLISEHEQLKTQEAAKSKRIENLELDLSNKNKEISTKNAEIESLNKDVVRYKEGNEHLTKKHDEMKENFVSLKLECTEKSLDQIFKLTEIAFRTPAKLRTFDTPVEVGGGYFSSGNGQVSTNGTRIERHQGIEKTEEA